MQRPSNMLGLPKPRPVRTTLRLLACTILLLFAGSLLVIQFSHQRHEILCVRDMGKLRLLLNPEEIFGGTTLSLNHRPVFAIHLGPVVADLEVFKMADIGKPTLIRRRTTSFEIDVNHYGAGSFGMSMTGTYFQAPYWFLCAVLLSYPFLLLLKRARSGTRQKTLPNLCVKCGYDLTALTEKRCPECGTKF
jgi:hypothetical protein